MCPQQGESGRSRALGLGPRNPQSNDYGGVPLSDLEKERKCKAPDSRVLPDSSLTVNHEMGWRDQQPIVLFAMAQMRVLSIYTLICTRSGAVFMNSSPSHGEERCAS